MAQGGSKAQFVSPPLGDGEVRLNHRQLGIFLLGSFLLGYVNLTKVSNMININVYIYVIYDIYLYIIYMSMIQYDSGGLLTDQNIRRGFHSLKSRLASWR